MPCEELEKLRATERELRAQMKESTAASARNKAGDRREQLRLQHGSHSVEFLKKRIERTTTAIEEHVAKHGCRES